MSARLRYTTNRQAAMLVFALVVVSDDSPEITSGLLNAAGVLAHSILSLIMFLYLCWFVLRVMWTDRSAA